MFGTETAAKLYAVRWPVAHAGVFSTWGECEPLVKGVKGALYQSFDARDEGQRRRDAEAFVAGVDAAGPGTAPADRLRANSLRVPSAQAVGANSLRANSGSGKPAAAAARPAGKATKGMTKSAKRAAQKQATDEALAALPPGALLLYTDGGCDGNTNVATTNHPAGWGAVALQKGVPGAELLQTLAELYGPVELSGKSPWFIGAEVASNNTGELSGIAHALLWLRDEGGHAPAAIVYDSEYAAKITQGVYQATKNPAIAASCRKLCSAEQKRRTGGVRFIHVKGHSDDPWNDKADALVQLGKTGEHWRPSAPAGIGPSLNKGVKKQAKLSFAPVRKRVADGGSACAASSAKVAKPAIGL